MSRSPDSLTVFLSRRKCKDQPTLRGGGAAGRRPTVRSRLAVAGSERRGGLTISTQAGEVHVGVHAVHGGGAGNQSR